MKFDGTANGRAYFGFGASSAGTLSLVAAPNTGQLVLQSNVGYGYTTLAAVSQGWQANHWYRLEVDWGSSGTIVGKLFDSNGTTLLNSVTGATTAITSGGIAFRSIGNYDKYFDTVTDTPGVNNFTGVATRHTLMASPGGESIYDAAFSPSGGVIGRGPLLEPPAAGRLGSALFGDGLFAVVGARPAAPSAVVAERGPVAAFGAPGLLWTSSLSLKSGPDTEASAHSSGGEASAEIDFWALLSESLDELV